ncbi:hypothetical protein RGU70_13670 [Herbaspirillum sp. RTI4]|uniref:spike base protein, RCAP_Rcc01079 family n=1 Tax=Herbaspirillum sp. RTI4 TaxID=3048640 RepID=UPI002AB367E8|nr:hypothetical protein [Herbaspirillum sp. RTI4]MDY7579362.1 hypothetical protein [Herbaspirillum sp. RTI4]MEA9980276.1 hypothetical protein [Herbaspirillum sp. RTI4]
MTFNTKYPFLDTTNDYTPINDIQIVTPNDAADLPNGPCKALIFMGAGTIKLTTPAGTTVTLTVSANWFGVTYIRANRIWATGTTIAASSIAACY